MLRTRRCALLRIKLAQIEPATTADLPKLAEADNLLDFLRGLNSPAKPSAAPKGRPRAVVRSLEERHRALPSRPHMSARRFADLPCEPGRTRSTARSWEIIGKTQKGKFDCENCHGPGSAHVKAGGGRGVGGIISFRPDDLSRTAEENNASASAATRKGSGQTGTAVRTMSAGSCAATATPL